MIEIEDERFSGDELGMGELREEGEEQVGGKEELPKAGGEGI